MNETKFHTPAAKAGFLSQAQNEFSATLTELAQSTDNISATASSVADQTTLLSLNATIEANKSVGLVQEATTAAQAARQTSAADYELNAISSQLADAMLAFRL